jgi:ubiquinone/menaquinone biosynthesis C-methylase UbiE
MTKQLKATESRAAEEALAGLPTMRERLVVLRRRLEPFVPLRPGARILDIGAAQGSLVVACREAGFDAVGVEPWQPAIEASRDLARLIGMSIPIVAGHAEALPFEDESIDFAFATSVLEHVDDPMLVFREVQRVLRPGGGFYFTTTSALSPIQREIRGFPLFPWYPPPLRRAIMNWAAKHRPEIVGHTKTPAVHWFTPWRIRRDLSRAGFVRVVNRWQLRQEDEQSASLKPVLRAARHNVVARYACDMVVPASAYLAIA